MSFCPFSKIFSLSKAGSSLIIICSYVGNLLFLFYGGFFLDRVSKKKSLFFMTILWLLALARYIFAESCAILLLCMVFNLGASAMFPTSLNVLTPLFHGPRVLHQHL